MIQIEFFQAVSSPNAPFLRVDALGDREHDEEHEREADAVNGRDLLGEQIGDRHEAEHQRWCRPSPTGISLPPMRRLNGNLYS